MDSLSHPGGAEKVLCDMSNALCLRNWDVEVLGWDPEATDLPFPVEESVRFENAALSAPAFLRDSSVLDRVVGCLGLTKERRHELRRLHSLKYKARYVRQKLEAYAPDVVVAFSPEAHYLLKKHLNWDGPVVITLHEGPKKRFARKHTGALRETLSEATVIQVLLPEYARQLRDYFAPKRVVVIPNAVPQFEFASELTVPQVICVGRIYPSKRQDLLIEAFAELTEDFPQWRLKLLGGAPEGDPFARKVREMIESRGLQDKVILAGVSDRVEKELLESSIFAFPSANEGFSLALTEAMSAGLSVVACLDCESVVAMLNTEEALMVEPKPNELAGALRKLMVSPTLRKAMGQRCKEQAKQYSPEEVWSAWDRILGELVDYKRALKGEC